MANEHKPYQFKKEQTAIKFADETTTDSADEGIEPRAWKLLIVDDDPEVHSISNMVLRNIEFEGSRIELISAYSALEGRKKIETHPDLSVILLDVVMETPSAGLDLVKHIRQVLHNRFVRIILRTGQPGQAPERSVVIDYDINDYKEKTDLTADKLITSVLSALRAYRDITLIEGSRRGLEQIIGSTKKMFELRSLSLFCTGALNQLIALLNLGNNAFYARATGFAATKQKISDVSQFTIVAGTGSYTHAVGSPIISLNDPSLLTNIKRAVDSRHVITQDGTFIAHFPSPNGSEELICAQVRTKLSLIDERLLKIFATNLGAAFDNLYLNEEIGETQAELIYTLGEVIESRCTQTGRHIQRVAAYSKLLGTLLQLSPSDIELLKIAAPLHDLGKIAVPDSILHKAGRLSVEEFEVIKTHPTVGFKLLRNSDRPMLKSAALVALQHHERWDGTGYPNGLVAQDIHIFSRIVGLADVFDALTNKRPYKRVWTPDEAFQYLRENSGTHFDPEIVEIALRHRSEMTSILDSYPD